MPKVKSYTTFYVQFIYTRVSYNDHTKCAQISDVYELHKAKRRIKFDLPVMIAFFVYAYAKQRLLEFFYDFLARVMKPADFELIEMDTG